MNLVPIVLLSIGLLLIVVVMAGDRQKGLELLRNIVLVIAGMILLAVVFAWIAGARS